MLAGTKMTGNMGTSMMEDDEYQKMVEEQLRLDREKNMAQKEDFGC